MTAVIFHSPFHALGSRRQTASSHRTADSFSEDRPLGWDPVARRAIGRAMEWLATATTAASGGNRELLLGQRPARRKCRPRHDADAGCRNPYFVSEEKAVSRSAASVFYFLIFCKCFMPSSKRLRKASTSSGVLSAQKDTRMAVSMASGSRPMAASVWLG